MTPRDAAGRTFEVLPDAPAVAVAAAERLISRIEANAGRPAICLTGGSGPKALYALLGSSDYHARIPWDRVHWFIGDERFVSEDDQRNNMAMARDIFLDRCAPPGNIHPIPTNAPDPDAAARLYEQELQAFHGANHLDAAKPLFDVVLMGLGPDGHTASLFPHAPSLHADELAVATEAGLEPFVERVTLTIPALAAARTVAFLVSGAEKADAARRAFGEAPSPATPASLVRSAEGRTVAILDRAAAAELDLPR